MVWCGSTLTPRKCWRSCRGYAKRTAKRMLSATRKRHAHVLANEAAISVQNEQQSSVQNGNPRIGKSA